MLRRITQHIRLTSFAQIPLRGTSDMLGTLAETVALSKTKSFEDIK